MTWTRNTVLIICALLAAGGCTLTPYENPNLGVDYESDHIKMAVKPRYKSIAVLPFFNDTESGHASKFARRSFFGNLAATKHYDLQPMRETDKILQKLPRKTLDPKEYKKLGKSLKTDLLAFGRVKEQTHAYGFVYAKTTVGVEISLVDAKTGETVWRADDERTRRIGGIDPFALYVTHSEDYLWARNVLNRYDELFRDMMLVLPDRSVK